MERTITIYKRHSVGCPEEADRFSRKCKCRIWLQYQQHGKQVQVSAKTRSWTEAQKKARDIEEGKTQPAAKTVDSAVQEWLVFREKNGLSTEKPTLMGKKLKEWCAAKSISYLHELTPDAVIRFRNSLPYKTKTSSSLKIHWSVISGFFGWAHGMQLIAENPVPNTKLHPQFKITVKKPEVVPPQRASASRA